MCITPYYWVQKNHRKGKKGFYQFLWVMKTILCVIDKGMLRYFLFHPKNYKYIWVFKPLSDSVMNIDKT